LRSRIFYVPFVLLACVLTACQPTSGLVWRALPLGSGIQPTGVSCPTLGTCFVVGQNGLILKTTNGGNTWSQVDLSNGSAALANFNLTAISCPTTLLCYITGNQGLILETTNGGQTFQTQYETVNGNLTFNDVACQSSGTPACVAVGNNNTVFVLSQLQGNWTADQAAQPGIGPANFNQVALFGQTIFISALSQSGQGVNGVSESTNGGTSFLFVPISTELASQGISGVACRSATLCLADGPGAILVTNNGGLSWVSVSVSTASGLGYLTGAGSTSDGSFWAYGSAGTLVQVPQLSTGILGYGPAVTQSLPGESPSFIIGAVSCEAQDECLTVAYSTSVPGQVYLSTAP
jgi:photosystem II stability/assembly factor-like uncharacterized protein